MSKIIKAHSLTGRITDGLMLDSFKAVKRNRGAAGIDKVSIKMFEANLADNLRALMRDLKSGSFHHTRFGVISFPRMKRSSARSAFQQSAIVWPRRWFAVFWTRSLNLCFIQPLTASAVRGIAIWRSRRL